MSEDIAATLQKAHNSLKNSTSCSLEFTCRVLGKLCFVGYAG